MGRFCSWCASTQGLWDFRVTLVSFRNIMGMLPCDPVGLK